MLELLLLIFFLGGGVIFSDGALFLESPFRSLLQALLELYVREDVISRVNLTSPIPGLPSFRDL